MEKMALKTLEINYLGCDPNVAKELFDVLAIEEVSEEHLDPKV